jgi:hypothetical protein
MRDRMESLKVASGKVKTKPTNAAQPLEKPKGLLFRLSLHRKKDDGFYIVSSSDGGNAFRYCGPD